MTPITARSTHELLEREAPLRALDAALEEARRGRGSLVLISGEPGIGKSALLSHFARERDRSARVLVGLCDDLAIPRPLGPFRDLADALSPDLAETLGGGSIPGEFATRLLRELRAGPTPTVLALEDVHWADQATVDALTVVARRLRELPVLLVLTLRPGELEPDDPLRPAIDAMQRTTTFHVELAPLSRAAVEQLAGDDTERIYELTRGNPFFVMELLAHGTEPPPPSLANAVLGRVARLDAPARALLELISVVPGRVPIRLLDLAEPEWVAAAAPAERRRLLTSDAEYVRFRHELTRAAIRSSLPYGRRRLLHRRILDALLQVDADPAEVVHHAEGAGDTEVVAGHALLAARHAAATGANREAFAHYQRTADLAVERRSAVEQAALFEELAHSAWLTGHLDEAIAAVSRAIDLAEQLGDTAAHGRCSSFRAHLHWFGGDGQAAWRDACAGVRSLEASGAPLELARAYAQSAELSMLASRADEALRWGQRAMQLAGSDPEIRARAIGAIGGAQLQLDIDNVDPVLEGLEVACRARLHEQAVFSLVALAYINLLWVKPDLARTHAEQSSAYAREHELDGMATFVDGLLSWLDLRAGRSGRALSRLPTDDIRTVSPGTIAEQQARMVRTEFAVRRGEGDIDEWLRRVAVAADRTGKLSRIGPVLELQIERALTCDAPLPIERFAEVADIVGSQALAAGCGAGRIAGWASVCGISTLFSGKAPAPHAAMIAGDWQGAADAFGAVGWHHDRALMLSLLDTAEALTEALAIARSLDAVPLEERVCRRLHEVGLPVPRGPLAATQANPAQLTGRQLEVLREVRRGHGNARIAELLHISPRTVEHHVAGIFTKLGVSSRAEAVARCADLGIT
ncbi:AAA family ATPase [Egicoccus sp. AB-alg6-2]|uniref:helix-turn-helix transcriptional regulator n=1 Tax=Egicoccus sp. AB-alg6-2 TaxID=3242692 RepID=UPI00359D11CF